MTASARQLSRFLQVVHARMTAMHAIECAALGVGAGAFIAVGLSFISLYRGTSLHPGLIAILLTAGGSAGAAFAAKRRPRALSVALTVDRQLKLDELVSSAVRLSRFSVEGVFCEALLDRAASETAAVSPFAIEVRRLSGRAWGMVLLMLALSASLLLFGPAHRSARTAPAEARPSPVAGTNDSQEPRAEAFAARENQPMVIADPDDAHSSRFGQNEAPDPSKDEAGRDADAERRSAGAADNASGAGASRTDVSPRPTSNTPDASAHPAPRSDAADHSSVASAGSGPPGKSAPNGTEQGASAGGTRVPDSIASPPPWKSPEWTADVQRADIAVTSGRVPAPYRSLVRDYFSR